MTRRRKNTTALVLLIVAIFAFWWGVSAIDKAQEEPNSTSVADQYIGGAPIAIEHSLVQGTDVYRGNVTLPSDCDYLGTGIASTGSAPAHVTLMLVIMKNTHCAAAQSDELTPFAVSLSHGSQAPVFDGVTVNGVIVPSRVIEAPGS